VCVCEIAHGWVILCAFMHVDACARIRENAFARVVLLIQHETRIRHIVCSPSCLHHIFRHYLPNGTIFGKKLLNIKRVLWFSLQLVFETFLSLRKTHTDIVINMTTSPCEIPVIVFFTDFNENWIFFSTDFREQNQIPNFIRIRAMGVELLYADGLT
jgi:hypothetical protein